MLSEIVLPASVGMLIIFVSTGIVMFFLSMGMFVSTRVDLMVSRRRENNMEQRSELYVAIQNKSEFFGIDKDDIAGIMKLRDEWSSFKNITHEQKLLLILAGYKIDMSKKVLSGLDMEALRVQVGLSNLPHVLKSIVR